jgi:hypothetical protein
MEESTVIFNFLAGGIAGAVASVATQPFYVAKTKMQQRKTSGEGGGGYIGIAETMAAIVQRDGLAGLWVGCLPVLVLAFPEAALQLGTHDWALASFGSYAGVPEQSLPVVLQVCAAGLAGIPSVLATNPMDMLAIQKIVEDEGGGGSSAGRERQGLGIEELSAGYATTWLRDVPFLGIYFPVFFYLSTCLSILLASSGLSAEFASIIETIAAGSLAGMLASALTTPADVINVAVKTHLLRESASRDTIFGSSGNAVIAPWSESRALLGLSPSPCDVSSSSMGEGARSSILDRTSGGWLQEEGMRKTGGMEFSAQPGSGQTCWRVFERVGRLPCHPHQDQRLMLTTSFARRPARTRGAAGLQGFFEQGRLVSHVACRLYAEGGASAFFSGMSARVSQVMPAQSLTISFYALFRWLADVIS